MKPLLTSLVPALPVIIIASAGHAQFTEAQYDAPSLDRWMYPFNGSPGTRFEMPVFGAVGVEGFDDHDAQVLVGFETDTEFTPALGADQYRIFEITVTLTVANDDGFSYDPTFDTLDTYDTGDTLGGDTDAGRPINLFLPGYRDGYDQSTYFENTTFGLIPDVPPAQGMRHAFAAIFDNDGIAQDISTNVKDQFEAVPLAIGTTDTVTAGDLVPADTTFSFTFSPCEAGINSHDELARMLDRGEIRFMVTSLAPATGGPKGGEGNYPIFYSRENPIAQIFGYTATLDIDAWVGSAGDFNGDGVRDFFDISGFLSSFAAAEAAADINADCQFDFFDISAFLTEYTN